MPVHSLLARSLLARFNDLSLSLSLLLLFLDLFKFFISVASSLRKVDLKGAEEGDRWMVGWMDGLDADIFVRSDGIPSLGLNGEAMNAFISVSSDYYIPH